MYHVTFIAGIYNVIPSPAAIKGLLFSGTLDECNKIVIQMRQFYDTQERLKKDIIRQIESSFDTTIHNFNASHSNRFSHQ